MLKDRDKPSDKNRIHKFLHALLNLPRIARIALVGFVALCTTFLMQPLIDDIYLRYFYAPETVIVPAIIAVICGFVMYVIGWQLIIGLPGETRPVRAAVLWYVLVAVTIILVIIILLIRGMDILY